jgi:hypothetical protein
MTDGKPTDDVSEALQRWRTKFANRVTLVAIGIGQFASLATLQQLTDNVLQLNVHTEDDYRKFVDWVTQSVVAQSRSVADPAKGAVNLAKLDDSIMKKITDIAKATVVDEDVVVLTGCCQNNKLPYVMKYERLPEFANPGINLKVGLYNLTGVYALEKDYYALSDDRALARTVNTDSLIGAPGCPHCGNPYGFAMCRCGQVMCIRGDGPAICPACNTELYFGQSDGEGFDVTRSRG